MTDDPNQPVVLASFANEADAAVAVAALEARGIQAHTTGALTSGFRAEAPGGVQVLVRRSELDRARDALGEMRGNVDGS